MFRTGYYSPEAQASTMPNGEHKKSQDNYPGFLIRPRGVEPLTSCFGGKRSVQLSYGRRSEFSRTRIVAEQIGAFNRS